MEPKRRSLEYHYNGKTYPISYNGTKDKLEVNKIDPMWSEMYLDRSIMLYNDKLTPLMLVESAADSLSKLVVRKSINFGDVIEIPLGKATPQGFTLNPSKPLVLDIKNMEAVFASGPYDSERYITGGYLTITEFDKPKQLC
jgi:hypothetical protein